MAKKSKNKPGGSAGGVDLIDKEKQKHKVKPPSKYVVIFHNDDYTPMDFVCIALISIFNKPAKDAFSIMMKVHEQGKAIAGGPYSKEIAETKAMKAIEFARQNGHPLRATFEKN